MKIGLFGGTFNPLHMGHLILAEQALWQLKLDKVIFIPCYLSPHKTPHELAGVEERLDMVRLSVEDNPHFEVSDYEMRKRGKSYSIDTIRKFSDIYGEEAEIFFITGSDSLKELYTWKEIEDIFNLSSFVIANRPGYPVEDVPEKAKVVVINPIEVSSSQIRDKIAAGESIRYLVPDKVREYIQERGLYRR